MELNKIAKKEVRYTVNPEGTTVYARRPEIQLYLEASNLKIKDDDFYRGAQDTLKSCISLAKNVDPQFLVGLSQFLMDNGLKLSPVVLSSVLADKGFSFDLSKPECADLTAIYNTPQRIAEAISLHNNDYLKLNNSFKKHVLRKALEKMNDYTLCKNQLKRRKVKTKDLIKLLRPTPKSQHFSELYKAIIEDKAKSPETLTKVKSDKTKTDSQKIEYYVENINTIPLNMLIRNLKFIAEKANFVTNVNLQVDIINRLNSINNFRFLNIFDIIEASMAVPRFETALFEVVKRFTNQVKEQFGHREDGTILFDISGSMSGRGIDDGFKYLALMTLLFEKVELTCFENRLHRGSGEFMQIIEDIKKGIFGKAKKRLELYFQNNMGGTSLISSANELLSRSPEIKNLVIISDEVTWSDNYSGWQTSLKDINEQVRNKNLIVVNPVVYEGTVFKENLVALASLTSGVVYNVLMKTNQDSFIRYIKNYSSKRKLDKTQKENKSLRYG